MPKVTQLPASSTMTVDQALESAKQLNLGDVLILGYNKDGEFCLRSSRLDRDLAFWLCHSGAAWIMENAHVKE